MFRKETTRYQSRHSKIFATLHAQVKDLIPLLQSPDWSRLLWFWMLTFPDFELEQPNSKFWILLEVARRLHLVCTEVQTIYQCLEPFPYSKAHRHLTSVESFKRQSAVVTCRVSVCPGMALKCPRASQSIPEHPKYFEGHGLFLESSYDSIFLFQSQQKNIDQT